MTKSTRLALPTSPSLAPRRSKRKIRIQSDSEDSGNDIEEGVVTKPPSNIPSASEKRPRVVRRRQLIPENDAGVEQGNGNVSDTDLAADITSGAESASSQTLASTNPPGIHNCTWPNCDKVFDDEGKLSEHIRSHTGEVSCEEVSMSGSEKQVSLVTDDCSKRPFACHVEGCGKCYMKNSQLQVHALTHDESAKTAFRCPIDYCEAAFANKYRLNRHLQLHEESDVACEWEGCGATFLKPFQLRNHMCIHTNKKPHPCTHESCEKSFDTRPKLKAHITLVHSKELRYCCGHEGCDAKFAKYTELQKHDKHDHEHKCTTCGKVYETRKKLAYHISTVHLQQELFACHWDGCEKEFKMVGTKTVAKLPI